MSPDQSQSIQAETTGTFAAATVPAATQAVLPAAAVITQAALSRVPADPVIRRLKNRCRPALSSLVGIDLKDARIPQGDARVLNRVANHIEEVSSIAEKMLYALARGSRVGDFTDRRFPLNHLAKGAVSNDDLKEKVREFQTEVKKEFADMYRPLLTIDPARGGQTHLLISSAGKVTGAVKDETAVPYLIAVLKNKHEDNTFKAATGALRRIADPAANPILRKTIDNVVDRFQRADRDAKTITNNCVNGIIASGDRSYEAYLVELATSDHYGNYHMLQNFAAAGLLRWAEQSDLKPATIADLKKAMPGKSRSDYLPRQEFEKLHDYINKKR